MKVKELITELLEFDSNADLCFFIEGKKDFYGCKNPIIYTNSLNEVVIKGKDEDTSSW
jgi:hypothetical protein